MKTPAGLECAFFYGNYYRGRKQEECRLIGNIRPPKQWTADLCKTCPVPGIHRANACPHMQMKGEVTSFIFNIHRRVKVTAFCVKSQQKVSEPEIGCGQCHPLSFDLKEKSE